MLATSLLVVETCSVVGINSVMGSWILLGETSAGEDMSAGAGDGQDLSCSFFFLLSDGKLSAGESCLVV